MRRTHLLREKGQVASPIAAEPATPSPRIAVLRIGAAGGLVGMLCCVGPTLLALLGIISAATAYAWGENLYGGYTWWFRAAGVLLMAGLVIATLRRQRRCSLRGLRGARRSVVRLLLVAVATYATLYFLTTGLGHLPRAH